MKRKPHFEAGSKRMIYQKPLTQEQPEEMATLVKCVRPHWEFSYFGLEVEEWEVRFEGDSSTFVRIIAEQVPTMPTVV